MSKQLENFFSISIKLIDGNTTAGIQPSNLSNIVEKNFDKLKSNFSITYKKEETFTKDAKGIPEIIDIIISISDHIENINDFIEHFERVLFTIFIAYENIIKTDKKEKNSSLEVETTIDKNTEILPTDPKKFRSLIKKYIKLIKSLLEDNNEK